MTGGKPFSTGAAGWIRRPYKENSPMLRIARRLWDDQEGTASVEYSLLLVVVVVASIGAWVGLRDRIIEAIQDVESSLSQ